MRRRRIKKRGCVRNTNRTKPSCKSRLTVFHLIAVQYRPISVIINYANIRLAVVAPSLCDTFGVNGKTATMVENLITYFDGVKVNEAGTALVN